MTRSLDSTGHSTVICLLGLAMLAILGLAACGDSTTGQCPARPTPTLSQIEMWVQAPGEVTMALPATSFGSNEYVWAAVFNHTKVIIETTPMYGRDCAFFSAERLVSGIWQAFNTCRPMSEAPGGGRGGDVNPGTYKTDTLRVHLSPGTYRLKMTYAIHPANPESLAGTIYSLPFQVCLCAQCP